MIFRKVLTVTLLAILAFLTPIIEANSAVLNRISLLNTRTNSYTNIISIPNFHRVDGDVFRGAQPWNADYTSLSRLGIKNNN